MNRRRFIFGLLAVVLGLLGFLVAVAWKQSLSAGNQSTAWFTVTHEQDVVFGEQTGRIRILMLRNQIPVGEGSPPLPLEAKPYLQTYAQLQQIDTLTDEQALALLSADSRKVKTIEDINKTRSLRKTHPHLFKEWVRYLVLFESGKQKALFICSASEPDTKPNMDLSASSLIWEGNDWRLWLNPKDTLRDTLQTHLNLTRPFDTTKFVIP